MGHGYHLDADGVNGFAAVLGSYKIDHGMFFFTVRSLLEIGLCVRGLLDARIRARAHGHILAFRATLLSSIRVSWSTIFIKISNHDRVDWGLATV